MSDDYTLVVPFLTEDPAFAYGVELGMLFERMRRGPDDVIGDCFTLENQDRILLMAGRIGWHVAEVRPWSEGWFWCRLERKS